MWKQCLNPPRPASPLPSDLNPSLSPAAPIPLSRSAHPSTLVDTSIWRSWALLGPHSSFTGISNASQSCSVYVRLGKSFGDKREEEKKTV